MTLVESRPRSEERKDADDHRYVAASRFVEGIRALDNGQRARLRRAAGTPLSHARNCAWFYGLVRPDYTYFDAEGLFLVATLMCDNRAARMAQFRGDFGKSLRQLANRGGEGGVERRLRNLLDSDFDARDGKGSLAHHLRQLSMRMLAARVAIDWAQLIVDVLTWTHPSRYVQREWAISYYGAGDEKRPDPDTPGTGANQSNNTTEPQA